MFVTLFVLLAVTVAALALVWFVLQNLTSRLFKSLSQMLQYDRYVRDQMRALELEKNSTVTSVKILVNQYKKATSEKKLKKPWLKPFWALSLELNARYVINGLVADGYRYCDTAATQCTDHNEALYLNYDRRPTKKPLSLA